ncbi:hypothetical protein [Alkalicoccobacillus murimartini]|uniref:Uncharacterized protein n=1 Tax=Alkalicoccobacillus murimartini TaxID=171685 RepID=A0ABT9YM52_9BACI|nr:hypothetical protein [Alkalicoccobacillus murimartini]MDQ0208928.1 hypothetical protein [Alkalicoccobacillus murimartini]
MQTIIKSKEVRHYFAETKTHLELVFKMKAGFEVTKDAIGELTLWTQPSPEYDHIEDSLSTDQYSIEVTNEISYDEAVNEEWDDVEGIDIEIGYKIVFVTMVLDTPYVFTSDSDDEVEVYEANFAEHYRLHEATYPLFPVEWDVDLENTVKLEMNTTGTHKQIFKQNYAAEFKVVDNVTAKTLTGDKFTKESITSTVTIDFNQEDFAEDGIKRLVILEPSDYLFKSKIEHKALKLPNAVVDIHDAQIIYNLNKEFTAYETDNLEEKAWSTLAELIPHLGLSNVAATTEDSIVSFRSSYNTEDNVSLESIKIN